MPGMLDRLKAALADRNGVNREIGRGGRGAATSAMPRSRPLLAALLLTVFACGNNSIAPTIQLVDRDRHAHFTADAKSVVYYRHDERPGATPGIYRVDLASGQVTLLAEAILAGLDLDPQTDSIVFSTRGTNETEPALWIMGPDGGGVRRLGGGGNAAPGFRWPAFSADGSRFAWETRYQDDPGLDTVSTFWIGDWRNGTIANAHAVGPGRHSAWRPDGAAVAVERRRPGDVAPYVIAVMDTTGLLLDTLGYGYEPTWRPDGATVAYLTEPDADRGCLGVCLVPAGGGAPVSFSTAFMSFPGGWTPNGAEFVYARFMRTAEVSGSDPPITVDESRLWIRTLATGADRQVTF